MSYGTRRPGESSSSKRSSNATPLPNGELSYYPEHPRVYKSLYSLSSNEPLMLQSEPLEDDSLRTRRYEGRGFKHPVLTLLPYRP